MTGISEILLLILLIAFIFILPRMFNRESGKKRADRMFIMKKLSVKTRGVIVLSVVYPICMSFYLKPWQDNSITFIFYGLFPVFLIWAMVWIISGRKK